MSLEKQIADLTEKIFPQAVEFRRHMHRHPELSFKEIATTEFIKQKLISSGIQPDEKAEGGGVRGLMKGNLTGEKVFALRADIDALPIVEETGASYASENPGVMHACGHDVHSACLFGSLLVLKEMQKDWGGTLRYIFQPGEEVLPGGASVLIEKGVLKNPKVDGIIAQHVYPELPSGKLGFRTGMYMASTDEIYISITGKGGHGALPHKLNDTVLAASQVVVQLQSIASRYAPAQVPTVLSVGKFHAPGATNVIPSKVELAGTFRTMDEKWRKEAHALIHKIVKETVAIYGCQAEVNIVTGYPVLHNDATLTQDMRTWAEDFLGKENVVELDLRMTAEDFAWYTHHVPGCFYRLGTADPDGRFTHSVHSPQFDIDESAIRTGIGFMAYAAIKYLSV